MTGDLTSNSEPSSSTASRYGNSPEPKFCAGSAQPSTLDMNPQPEVQDSTQVGCEIKKSKREQGWRRIVRNFTPSWFSVNMGTGIVSILLHNLPYNGEWLYWISVVIFVLNVALFTIFFTLSFLRYTLYPRIWVAMIKHPAQSLFLGTFPMGLATIINMIVFICVPVWGSRAVQLAWALWWFDMAVSLACCLYVPFAIMTLHPIHTLPKMTAAWLLPIVAPIVAAATGGIVAEVLPNPEHALWTIIASYILWGTGVPLAMAVVVIYFQRLTLHSLPPIEVAVSVFLPLGPLGQGGYAIMQLGKVAMDIFPQTLTLSSQITDSGKILYVVGWLTATIMWGFAMVWMFFATMSVTKTKFPFNMGWWGFTFPLGVFTVSTVQMGKELPSLFFDVFGTITSLAVTFLWLVVGVKTILSAKSGILFVAPDLVELNEKAPNGDVESGGVVGTG